MQPVEIAEKEPQEALQQVENTVENVEQVPKESEGSSSRGSEESTPKEESTDKEVKRKKSKRRKSKKETAPEKGHSSDDEPLILKHANASSRSLPNAQSPANVYLPPSTSNYIQQSIALQQFYAPTVVALSLQRTNSKASQSSRKSRRTKRSVSEASMRSSKLSTSPSKGSLQSVDTRRSKQSQRRSFDVSLTDFSRPSSRSAPFRPVDEEEDEDQPLALVKDNYQTKTDDLNRTGRRKSVSFPIEPVSDTKFVEPTTPVSEVSETVLPNEKEEKQAEPEKGELEKKPRKKKSFIRRLFGCFGNSHESVSPTLAPEEEPVDNRRLSMASSYRSLDPKASEEYSPETANNSLDLSNSDKSFDPRRASMLDIQLPEVRTSPLRVGSVDFQPTFAPVESIDLSKGLEDVMAKYMTSYEPGPEHKSIPISSTRTKTLTKREVAPRKSMDLELDEELLQYKNMF